jgi:MFS family permease
VISPRRAACRRAGALPEPRFRPLFAAQLVSLVGDNFMPVALAFAVLEATHSASALGIALAARTLPLVVLVLFGGVLSDRIPRKWVMVASDVIRAVSQAVLAYLVLLGGAKLAAIATLQAVNGASTAFYRPALTGLVPELVDAERLQGANALLGLSASFASVSGPVLAGLLVAAAGPGWAIAADAVTFVVSAVMTATVRPAHRGEPLTHDSLLADLAAGWREVTSRAWVWASILNFALFQFAVLAAFSVLGPVVASREGGPAGWALIVAAMGAGSVLGGVVTLGIRPRRPVSWAMASLLLAVPGMALLGVAAPPPLVALAILPSGAGISVSNALWLTVLQQRIPAASLSRVSAYDWMGSMALRPLGQAVIGPVAVAIGTGPALLGATGLICLSTLSVLSLRSVRSVVAVKMGNCSEGSERPNGRSKTEQPSPDHRDQCAGS